MMCQILFSWEKKKRKILSICRLLNLPISMVSVNLFSADGETVADDSLYSFLLFFRENKA